MEIDSYGRTIINEQEALESLYSGKVQNLENLFFTDNVSVQFNLAVKENADKIPTISNYDKPSEDLDMFDEANRSNWFMPEEYLDFPIHQWLLDQCSTDEQKQRVEEELLLFIQHNVFDVLFYLKYLVDTMRENNIVWGVGRGSSVASYILYLIGVHKIDSIKYNLDIKEFLK